jgi:hypothetical protein
MILVVYHACLTATEGVRRRRGRDGAGVLAAVRARARSRHRGSGGMHAGAHVARRSSDARRRLIQTIPADGRCLSPDV